VVSDESATEYKGIVREVVVNTTDDGTLDCADFESRTPEIDLLGGNIVNGQAIVCRTGELSTSVEGAVRYTWWLEGQYPELSSTSASCQIPVTHKEGKGIYTVIAWKDDRCKAVSEPVEVEVKQMPAIPVITGKRIVRTGENIDYEVVKGVDKYKWILAGDYGYSFYLTDPNLTNSKKATITIGHTSSVIRVVAISDEICPGVEGRLNVEVRSTYSVNVYPTVVSPQTTGLLKIVPKNMQISNIALVSTVGESYSYRRSSGKFPLNTNEEMTIDVSGLPTGQYFIVFYGREQNNGDTQSDGRSIKHVERIVVQN
jgi:hypothetical protein